MIGAFVYGDSLENRIDYLNYKTSDLKIIGMQVLKRPFREKQKSECVKVGGRTSSLAV